MSNMNQVASDLYKALTESDAKKPKAYDTKAEVLRVENDIVWVKIPGGIDETPVSRTNNANVGDQVMVRLSNGRAFLLGNETSPATDDAVANVAVAQSNDALEAAGVAQAASDIAKAAANSAIADAEIAQERAEQAIQSASDASIAANNAQESARQADQHAADAADSANSAQQSANRAFDQLSWVEDIVGVLDLISKNGAYKLTADEEVIPNKWYFTVQNYKKTTDTVINENKTYYTRSATEPYVYTIVENPIVSDIDRYYDGEYAVVPNPFGDPSSQNWYELRDIDQSIQNYVSSHLALTNDGLFLQQDGINAKLQLSSEGVILYGPNGNIVGKYGQTAQIGDIAGFHIEIDGSELGFYQADRKIAYLSNNQLYITQSVVLQQMDLGTPIISGGLGQWSWKIHNNGNNPPRNNLNLKWVG